MTLRGDNSSCKVAPLFAEAMFTKKVDGIIINVASCEVTNLAKCSFLLIDGQHVPPEQAHEFAIKQMESFQGYNGYGYFTLGKPILTGILANFATYLIILIQFKTSE